MEKHRTHDGEHKWIGGDSWCQVWNCEARYFEWSQAEIKRLQAVAEAARAFDEAWGDRQEPTYWRHDVPARVITAGLRLHRVLRLDATSAESQAEVSAE